MTAKSAACSTYTFLPAEQIDNLTSVSGESLREAKRTLAYESTALTHGIAAAEEARSAAARLFSGRGAGNLDPADDTLPTVAIQAADGLTIADLFVQAGLASSRGDARRTASQGGLSISDERISDVDQPVSGSTPLILRAGKKRFMRVIFNG